MFTILKQEKIPLKGIVKQAYKGMGRAISDYDMLRDGDRILVSVSGGADSLSLLKLFQMRKERVPIDFEIIGCFVNTSFIKIDKGVLIDHFQSCGIEYAVEKLDLDDQGMNCFWCSWNRRKVLFNTARKLNCNKIALGHNLDDIIETTLMNLFFRGEIGTAPPALDLFGGEIKIIRPLCYLEKKDIFDFASQLNLPVTHYECDYGKDSKRELMKTMIKELAKQSPFIKKNIFRALGRIKQGYLV